MVSEAQPLPAETLQARLPELKAQLWRNAERLYNALKAKNLWLGPELSPVVAIRRKPKVQ